MDKIEPFQPFSPLNGMPGKVIRGVLRQRHGDYMHLPGGRTIQAADISPEDGSPDVTVYLLVKSPLKEME